MPTTKSATAPTVTTIEDPSKQETCDRCGSGSALATVQVVFPTQSGNEQVLLFCAHHAVQYGFAERAVAYAAYATSANVYL